VKESLNFHISFTLHKVKEMHMWMNMLFQAMELCICRESRLVSEKKAFQNFKKPYMARDLFCLLDGVRLSVSTQTVNITVSEHLVKRHRSTCFFRFPPPFPQICSSRFGHEVTPATYPSEET